MPLSVAANRISVNTPRNNLKNGGGGASRKLSSTSDTPSSSFKVPMTPIKVGADMEENVFSASKPCPSSTKRPAAVKKSVLPKVTETVDVFNDVQVPEINEEFLLNNPIETVGRPANPFETIFMRDPYEVQENPEYSKFEPVIDTKYDDIYNCETPEGIDYVCKLPDENYQYKWECDYSDSEPVNMGEELWAILRGTSN